MKILAIDPGPKESAYVVWDGSIVAADTVENMTLRNKFEELDFFGVDRIAIEMVACYGMAVGAEVFETCKWIGRFEELVASCGMGCVEMVYRKDVKMHLCQSMRAKDGNIRQALIDKHGVVGTKKNPGPLFGISGHLWAALAVADYAESILK
jgi:hypothetical protein